jgi:UPF0271 protein
MDINCDMGEIAAHVVDGTQEALMQSVTSVNIACGGHAGDEAIMLATIEQAMRAGWRSVRIPAMRIASTSAARRWR